MRLLSMSSIIGGSSRGERAIYRVPIIPTAAGAWHYLPSGAPIPGDVPAAPLGKIVPERQGAHDAKRRWSRYWRPGDPMLMAATPQPGPMPLTDDRPRRERRMYQVRGTGIEQPGNRPRGASAHQEP